MQQQQDSGDVYIDIDLPGVAAKDVQVQVLNEINCVVEWTAERRFKSQSLYHNPQQQQPESLLWGDRLQLGPAVDCANLAANLSRGVLTLSVPVKSVDESQIGPRDIPIQQSR